MLLFKNLNDIYNPVNIFILSIFRWSISRKNVFAESQKFCLPNFELEGKNYRHSLDFRSRGPNAIQNGPPGGKPPFRAMPISFEAQASS